MVEDQVRTEAQATGGSSVGCGPQTITGAFLAISDSLTATHDNSRALGGLRVAGPPPEREEAPPEARQEASGESERGVIRSDEARPC